MQAEPKEVSADKATTPAAELRLVTVEQLNKIHRELDACQKVIWLRGGFDPAYVTDAQEQLKVIEALMENQAAATEALVPCGECHEGLRMIDPYDGGTFITCSRCNGRGMLTTCPTCFGAVPADRAHLLESEQAATQWTNNKPNEPGAYWVRGFRIGEPDSRPALVEVARNEEGELLCNVNEHNTNDETHQWSHVEDMADRFEWFGPLGVKTTRERELTHALDLAVRSLDQLVPYLGKVPADIGLLNEALMAGRKALQGGAV